MATGGENQYYIGPYAGDTAADNFLSGKGYAKPVGTLYFDNTAGVNVLKVWDGSQWVALFQQLTGGATFKSYTVSTQGLAGATRFAAGFYQAPAADANLTQAAASTTYGTANVAYGAHAFIVAGGPGTTDVGTVSLQVGGASVDDQGNVTLADTETIVADITTLVLNQYVESTKKWVGTVTWQLIPAGGATTYALDINYGFAKYEDFGNRDFTVTDVEVIGLAGATDGAFDVDLLLHSSAGWTYSAAAFAPGGTIIASISTDWAPDDNIANGEYFAWKRDNLSQAVVGSGLEGIVVRYNTNLANAIEYMNIHVGVTA